MSKRRRYNTRTENQVNNIKNNDDLLNSQNAEKKSLSDQEFKEFMKYTEQIMNSYSNTAGYPMTFTPMLTNDRLASIGFTPKELSATELKEALKDPVNSSEMLIAYSEWLQFGEAISKRTLGYIGNLPSFDYTFICTNPPQNRKDKDYLADKARLKEFLECFDVKGEFAKIHRRTLVTDAYFGIFRMDAGKNYTFQELPANNCLITGKNADYGFTFDFNMEWFLKQGISINQYPSAMKKLWARVFGPKMPFNEYDPSKRIDDRKGTFSTWAQTSPLQKDGGFTCFKFNSDIYAIMPFLTPLFNDAINKGLVREMQNNQYIIASQKILVGLIPLLKDQKSGSVANSLAFDADTMRLYLGFLKKGLNDAIKISGVPFSDVKDINYTLPDKNMYTDYTTNLAGNSSVSSRIIYSSDKQTSMETLLSTEVDSSLTLQTYNQYATWLSSMVNSLMVKYKFKFSFEGNNFSSNKKERLDTALKLADKGIVLPQKIAASIGMNVFDLEEQLMSGAEGDFKDNLYLLLNSNTKDYGEDVGGRPKTDTPNESTDRKDDRIIENEGGEE
ncbi:MAG: hypothetical protein WC240_05155 [Bacilli bacterium]